MCSSDLFSDAARGAGAQRSDIRTRLGVRDESPLVLYAAKFQARKRPADLLRAAALLQQDGVPFHLVMVGSGEQEAELRELSSSLGLANVHFPGFVNQSALPGIYAASDVLVLPSENEPWGLAINEAMCADLPIIASEEVGCVRDLVKDGVNGRTFPAGNVPALAGAMRAVLWDGSALKRMGAASREIISHWSYAECREGLRTALKAIGVREKLSRLETAGATAPDGPVR